MPCGLSVLVFYDFTCPILQKYVDYLVVLKVSCVMKCGISVLVLPVYVNAASFGKHIHYLVVTPKGGIMQHGPTCAVFHLKVDVVPFNQVLKYLYPFVNTRSKDLPVDIFLCLLKLNKISFWIDTFALLFILDHMVFDLVKIHNFGICLHNLVYFGHCYYWCWFVYQCVWKLVSGKIFQELKLLNSALTTCKLIVLSVSDLIHNPNLIFQCEIILLKDHCFWKLLGAFLKVLILSQEFDGELFSF